MFGILVGSKDRDIVFPAEVCRIVDGQIYKKVSTITQLFSDIITEHWCFYKKKVPQESTPEVVKFATSRPERRLETITKSQQGDGMQAPVSKARDTLHSSYNIMAGL
jgi:hypothetical protein